MKPTLKLAALLLCLLIALPAAAKNWVIDYPRSALGFTGKEGDTQFTGNFNRFAIDLDFDPDQPEAGKIRASVDAASITTGSTDRDSYLPGSDWFDFKNFAQATFSSTMIRKNGDGYAADGDLTIKGVSRPVTLDFKLVPEGDHFRAKGGVKLNRTDFGLGTGDWANENYLKFNVNATFDIVAAPVP